MATRRTLLLRVGSIGTPLGRLGRLGRPLVERGQLLLDGRELRPVAGGEDGVVLGAELPSTGFLVEVVEGAAQEGTLVDQRASRHRRGHGASPIRRRRHK